MDSWELLIEQHGGTEGVRTYFLERKQKLPKLVKEVFSFFEAPENLALITPPWLRFRLLAPSPVEMKVGAIIDYTSRWLGIPLPWRTQITAYRSPEISVDEQVKGPYVLWHHAHAISPFGGGHK